MRRVQAGELDPLGRLPAQFLRHPAGEAKAHTVRAACLARLGRIGDCETALDNALTAARRAREHRRVNAVLAGAPLAALWGPNPVPRAGGRCLDVVRLLRITTDSPAVEATSTRCQAVLEAFRGRAAAARRMIDSARRTVTELGLRHALLEVEQFAGIVELVIDDPGAAEPHLRKAYNGFRRMHLDADTAETAALLGRTCLALDRDVEADELCTESERLAGHALKSSIAWRTLRAQLLSRAGDHDEARRVAEAAVALAERTDALVDHGDACLALATVLDAAGDGAGARAAAERAVDLYERKGAAALAEKARRVVGAEPPPAPAPPAPPSVELDTACVRAIRRLDAEVHRESWDEVELLVAPVISVESHRKIVGFPQADLPPSEWARETRRFREMGAVWHPHVVLAARGERLALTRLELGTADVSPGAPRDEMLQLFGLDEGGRIALHVWFDLEDMDAALVELDATYARSEQEQPKARRPENAASRVAQRFWTCFSARDWEALTEILADNASVEDRRPVVNYGLLRGRDSVLEGVKAAPDTGVAQVSLTLIAIRGEHLALTHILFSSEDQRSEAFQTEFLVGVEIDADERISANVLSDANDVAAAIADLDARYLAGEAAAHAHTWSVIASSYVSIRRDEFPAMTPDCVTIDHRRVVAFAPGELTAYLRAGWDLDQTIRPHVEVVHRLSDLGAVCTYTAHGVSRGDFDAEWREVAVSTVEGDLINRCELFDETDLDAALARFEQLSRQLPRLENAASHVDDRFDACLAGRDWDSMAEMLADDVAVDDRRHLVNVGIRHGRDAAMAEMRTIAELGVTNIASGVIATRGERLVLRRDRWSGRDMRHDAFYTEVLGIIETDADERIVARVGFDSDDIDAAFEELDARYLAGEAAAHAYTWSIIMTTYAALNRREPLPTTPDWVNIDHRRGRVPSFAPGELPALLAAWNLTPDLRSSVEAVYRLNDLGAVTCSASRETSQEGVNAEWRVITVVTIDGDLVNRCEIFDEDDLDAALARFEQLSRPLPRLENAATQVDQRFWSNFPTCGWDVMAEILTVDFSLDDRRQVLNAGIRQGRDTEIENLKAMADVGGGHVTSAPIATRGERLALRRLRFSGQDEEPEAFYNEMVGVVEINTENQLSAHIAFDVDDVDTAFAELDARYLVGEGAAYAHTWSLIANVYAGFNRHRLPATTTDCVGIDHRSLVSAEGDLPASIPGAVWDQMPDMRIRMESVHRLSDLGTVVTHTAHGVTPEGFDAEWRMIFLYTVQDDLLNRYEVFDEAHLDAALARFDELQSQTRRLENAASQVGERYQACFSARDWVAMAELMADDIVTDDRRRIVNAGVRQGRDVHIADSRTAAEVGAEKATSSFIATRGKRLALARIHSFNRGFRADEDSAEVVGIVEIDTNNKIAAIMLFDLDDIDAAFSELDTRYLAGEAAAHAQTWSIITAAVAALNRHEIPATTPDYVIFDHHLQHTVQGTGGLSDYMRASWDLAPDFRIYIEAVHRLSNLGAVITIAVQGISQEGFEVEWRRNSILTVDANRISRYEGFDESDLDAALARFEELRPAPSRLGNAASQLTERYWEYFAARDWDAMAALLAEGISTDDRRAVVGAGVRSGRDAEIAEVRTTASLGTAHVTPIVIAVRGQRLALMRILFAGRDQRPEAFHSEILGIVELDDDNLMAARFVFDSDDLPAAFEELDARYMAGEAAAQLGED